jgi:hypothetical protein
MSPETIEQALPSAIRRAASEPPPATGDGWTVCIVTGEGRHDLHLAGQAQVARLALDLERLGFVLQVEGEAEADFVFEQAALEAG